MTDIIKLAREAGFSGSVAKMWEQHFERFAELVAAPLKADAERYRWLVNRHFLGVNNRLPYIAQYPSPESHGIVQMVIEGPDVAIDAARAKEQT